MKIIFTFLIFLFFIFNGQSQFKNNIWCFGDSAGIKFTNGLPSNFTTSVKSRGSCVSIADSNDSLLFYAFTRAGLNGNTTRVYDKSNNLMQNGDSIVGEGWYQELVIVPMTSEIFLFSIGVTGSSQTGLYYSKIDMSLNNGLGAVAQKNIQPSNKVGTDCLTALKHGNGHDWWLIFRSATYPADTNDIFYLYLIDSNGVNSPKIEHAGLFNIGSGGGLTFSRTGNQFVKTTHYGVVELFDFDRCTGNISSNKIIEYASVNSSQFHYYWFSAFSPSGRYLYVSESDKPTYLYQYDLQAPNVTLSRVTIDSIAQDYAGGGLKLAPDGKIYMSTRYLDAGCGYFPYCDTTYNMYNMNLRVINEPDSAGLACNFTKYSYYLGGKRTYWCLPNNPDYDLPGDSGCSAVNLTPALSKGEGVMPITYVAAWEKLFVNAQNLKGKDAAITIYDGRGSLMFEVQSLKAVNGYFTLDLDCSGWAGGLYVVHLETEREVLSKKFVKE